MKLFKLPVTIALAAAMLAPAVASAWQTIAHRGVYHDVVNSHNLPENSYFAVTRAKDLGLPGVEIDLRLASDGTVLVTHDQIANRTTFDDYSGGWYNPIDGIYHNPPNTRWINQDTSSHWTNTLLKIYVRNGVLDREAVHNWEPSSYMQSLDSLFQLLDDHRRDISRNANFKIILDIQDPTILHRAADIVKQHGLQDYIYLKFFASKGLYNASWFKYNGSDTCYVYAKDNNLLGLKIIPQINDGEVDVDEDDTYGINAFQTRLSIGQYLQCWADAQAQHWDAAKMPIVSASVPKGKPWAWNAAWDAINWARSHGRQTMSIIPNPDAGRWNGTYCQPFTFQSDFVSAAFFNDDARNAKQTFVNQSNPDYVIIDIMGDIGRWYWSSDFKYFRDNLC